MEKLAPTEPRFAALTAALADRRDDLIALTQDLIRIPTLNPPGENYREICDYLDRRLRGAGFQTQLIRAFGTPGDCDAYPRWNVVARREANTVAIACILPAISMSLTLARAGRLTPLAGCCATARSMGAALAI